MAQQIVLVYGQSGDYFCDFCGKDATHDAKTGSDIHKSAFPDLRGDKGKPCRKRFTHLAIDKVFNQDRALIQRIRAAHPDLTFLGTGRAMVRPGRNPKPFFKIDKPASAFPNP